MGTTERLTIQARNLYDSPIDMFIELGGNHPHAYIRDVYGTDFESETIAPGDRAVTISGLIGWGEAMVEVEVMSASPALYNLSMSANVIDGEVTDSDEINVLTGYPASFPGLSLWAIVFLFLAAGLVYFKISFV
jgi:hypothetical protein